MTLEHETIDLRDGPPAVICKNCTYTIGHIIERMSMPVLELPSGGQVRALYGWCPNCGADIAWVNSDVSYKRLMDRIESREKVVAI